MDLAPAYQLSEVLHLDVKSTIDLIETEGLKSMWSDKDPVFQSLLQQIHSWNGQVMDLRLNKIDHINNASVQDQIYRLLRNNLIEVLTTKNRLKQIEYLDKVKTWYYQSLSKTQKSVMEKTLENISSQVDKYKLLQALKINDKIYRSENYQSSLTDFWNKYRSIHTHIEPPEDRVKNYQRKNLTSAVSNITTTITRPGTSSQFPTTFSSVSGELRPNTSEQYRMIDRVQTAKLPKTSQTQRRVIQSQQGQRNHPSSDWLSNQQFPVFEAYETKAPKPIAALQRTQSPLKFDKTFDEETSSPLRSSQIGNEDLKQDTTTKQDAKQDAKQSVFGFEAMKPISNINKLFQDDTQTQRAYDDCSPLKQHNQQIETQSNYLLHDPLVGDELQEQAMLRMQEKYHKNRNIDTRNKREDEELLNTIQEWANNRGRVSEMMCQKTETLNIGSKYGSSGIKMSDLFIHHNKKEDEELIIEAEFDEVEAYQKYIDTTKPKGYIPQPIRKSSSGLFYNRASHTMMFDVKPLQVGGSGIDYQEKVIGLEQKLKYDKLFRLKQSRGSLVPGGSNLSEFEPKEHERLKKLSSSSYSRPQTSIANRPFSGIYKRLGSKAYVSDAINEVMTIKKVLVRNQTAVSVRTLQKSLIIPVGLTEPRDILLPGPGAGLSEPPEFSKETKKTNKKKKR